MASRLGTKEGSEEYGKGAFADTSISVKKTSTEPKIEEEEEEEVDDVSWSSDVEDMIRVVPLLYCILGGGDHSRAVDWTHWDGARESVEFCSKDIQFQLLVHQKVGVGGGHLGSIAALPGIRGAAETRAHSYAGYADQASKLPNTATNLLKQITI